ncbi:uncharacterized protein FIBRA_02603 [Fibroporia radiculosa]|uniref:N-acetyltransferase domain-containing protein n=1 Tax=Fibroporia radiculosa TaxID=599839 RepID=J4H1Y2_9APHY|nr:uncharacterized protein FIBRA_02603 [Fibroporia radiculosa]CCM00569.1 predicted protein [Fibroporia radiculosa]
MEFEETISSEDQTFCSPTKPTGLLEGTFPKPLSSPGKRIKVLIRDATSEDLPALVDIFNEEIATSTCTFRMRPVDIEDRRAWLSELTKDGYPCLVAIHADDTGKETTIGWCNLSRYRYQEAYNACDFILSRLESSNSERRTVEISMYTHRDFRGRNIGSKLLKAILLEAQKRNYRTILAMVAADPASSDRERFWVQRGFELRGTLRELGFKFDRWVDVGVYQLMLEGLVHRTKDN